MPILLASWIAAPSARLSCGIGSVNDSCTIPSPVVSPYGRTMLMLCLRWHALLALRPLRSLRCRRSCLQGLRHRVVVVLVVPGHAVQALASVGGAFHDAERAVGDRGQQRVVDDLLEQLHRLAQHLVRALLDEAARG